MSQPYVVGIAGGSCSGKSTFADLLVGKLQPLECGLINMDRYYRHNEGPMVTLSDGERFADYNAPDSTDHARALDDLKAMTQPVIVVEGLMVLHLLSLREILDLRVFIETEGHTRAVRRMIRAKDRSPDKPLEWGGRYYLECAIPGHEAYIQPSKKYADLIVAGDLPFKRAATFIAEGVRSSLTGD